jgi:exonuclease III
MDLLQWNLNEFLTRLTHLQALIQYFNPAILCLQETDLHPAHTLNICDFTPYCYDHLDSDSSNGGTAILVQYCIYLFAVNS